MDFIFLINDWTDGEVSLCKTHVMLGTQTEIIAIVCFMFLSHYQSNDPKKESFLVVCGIALKLFLCTKYLVSDLLLTHLREELHRANNKIIFIKL